MINKKGQTGLSGISNGAMTLMITGLILVFSIIIISQFGDMDVIRGEQINASDVSYGYAGTDATSAYNDTIDAVTSFSDWLPIIALLVVAGIVIFLIVRAFPRTN